MSSPADHTTPLTHPTPTVDRVEGIRSFSGDALRRARIAAGLSHDTLGRRIGRSRRHLIRWEQGSHPTPALLVLLADALDIDPLQLLEVTETTATLTDLRGRAGLASADVAEHLGVHPTTYRRLERGVAPITDDTATTLAALFNTTPDRIVDAYRRARADQ